MLLVHISDLSPIFFFFFFKFLSSFPAKINNHNSGITTTQANDGDSPNHCRVPAAVQPPVLRCRLRRYAGGNHRSFLYKVFMFCWWCTATELASWRDQDIQGPLKHFYCQNCCDNCIPGGDNLETSFPSALKLVAVFPFGSGDWGWGENTPPLVCCSYQWVSHT